MVQHVPKDEKFKEIEKESIQEIKLDKFSPEKRSKSENHGKFGRKQMKSYLTPFGMYIIQARYKISNKKDLSKAQILEKIRNKFKSLRSKNLLVIIIEIEISSTNRVKKRHTTPLKYSQIRDITKT